MKIAHVTATFPPYWAGTGNVAYHNARVIHEQGHDVTVFTAAPVGKEKMSFPFQVEYLPSRFRIGNAPVTPDLIRRLKDFDVIHLHYPYIFGSELVAWALTKERKPLVITYHNDLLSPGLRGMAFKAYNRLNQRWILSQADRLVATSEDYANHSLLRRFINTKTVLEIPNGVDTDLFVPRAVHDAGFLAKYHLLAGVPTILFVGAMDRAHFFKGVPVLLESLKSFRGVQAVFVGDGDMRTDFEAQVPTESQNRYRFVGSVPLEDLIHFYQFADVTVLPSLTMGEAFGMVLIESLSCGTPVIASNLPGVRTVVEDGVDGHVFKPGDSKDLAEKIHKILFVDNNRIFGRSGREKVLSKYSWRTIGTRLERIYEEVIAK